MWRRLCIFILFIVGGSVVTTAEILKNVVKERSTVNVKTSMLKMREEAAADYSFAGDVLQTFLLNPDISALAASIPGLLAEPEIIEILRLASVHGVDLSSMTSISSSADFINLLTKTNITSFLSSALKVLVDADLPIELQNQKLLELTYDLVNSYLLKLTGVLSGGYLLSGVKAVSPLTNSTYSGNDCSSQLGYFWNDLLAGKDWALDMIDSWGKPRSGLLTGDMNYIGSYDECNAIETFVNGTKKISGSYSTLQINLSKKLTMKLMNSPLPLKLSIGICAPNHCMPEAYKRLVNDINGAIASFSNSTDITLSTFSSDKDISINSQSIAVIAVFSLVALATLVATLLDGFLFRKTDPYVESVSLQEYSTETKKPDILLVTFQNQAFQSDVTKSEAENEYEHYESQKEVTEDTKNEANIVKEVAHHKEEKTFFQETVQTASLFATVPKLFAATHARGAIECLNGLRVLSMAWVILGHTLVFIPSFFNTSHVMITNLAEVFTEQLPSTPFRIFTGAYYAVDTFFFLSGLLVSFITLRKFGILKSNEEKRVIPFISSIPLFYLHRFLRLTPVYLLLCLLLGYIYPLIGSGPQWQGYNDSEAIACQNNWWSNILYINNFYPEMMGTATSMMCHPVSWYLSNDMQFYILSPLFLLFLLSKNLRLQIVGVALNILAIVGSMIFTGMRTYNIAMTDPSFLSSKGLSIGGVFFKDIYIKPYSRYGPYGVGILVGYVLLKLRNKFNINWVGLMSGWTLCSLLGAVLVFVEQDRACSTCEIWTATSTAAFEAVKRTSWAVVLGWIVISCHFRRGNVINSFLGWKGWIPLSRLTFGAYLMHPIIMYIFYKSLRYTLYWDGVTITMHFLGFLIFAYLIAIPVTLLLEAPLSTLELSIRKLFSLCKGRNKNTINSAKS